MRSKHRPQRTCVVCREKREKRQLTRLVIVDDKLQVDRSGKANGRGAYLCGKPACWSAAGRSLLSRALRRELHEDDCALLRQMTPS